MNRLIGVLFCVVFLSSCSSLWNDEVSDSQSAQDSEKVSFDDSVFDDSSSEDDEEINNKPKDLESIEATIKIKKVWRQSVGASNEVYQPTLHQYPDEETFP